jgi:hypothetical protein
MNPVPCSDPTGRCPGAPLDGIAVGVSRRTAGGEPEGGWTPHEILPIEAALSAYSAGVAYQAFAERIGAELRRVPVPTWSGWRVTLASFRRSSCPRSECERPIYWVNRSTRQKGGAMTVPTNASAGNPLFDEHEGTLRRALGLPSLVLFGLVYMVPLTVFTTYGIVTETTGGRLPVAYVLT